MAIDYNTQSGNVVICFYLNIRKLNEPHAHTESHSGLAQLIERNIVIFYHHETIFYELIQLPDI